MKLKLTLTPDNGDPIEVESSSKDILNWERTTKGASFGSFIDNMHLADLYKIAWFAARRINAFGGTLKEFEETYELDLDRKDEDDDEDELDPTQ
ncbi:hypothetical protein [Prauserella flavalba]|uniref:Uncharacterized protein n=1 Tax=Prauserella flavalba TaxID=1477506 RepID=A0A318L8W6_9PSEU|nr:hypothetical protein [Prauserella flavalba]PXY17347.1 hypothetical protein BA062_37695 [Prauserella flavalba]